MKYFAFSDVHGCLRSLEEALDRAGYDPEDKNHRLLFLGDAFDKKQRPPRRFRRLVFSKRERRAGRLTWLMGNHDDYLVKVLTTGEMNKFCCDTVRNIAIGYDKGTESANDTDCIKILQDHGVGAFIRTHGQHYYETERYVFTHGFIPFNKKASAYDPNWRSILKWNHSDNGMKRVLLQGIRIPQKTLVCGHVGAYYGRLVTTRPDLESDSAAFKKECATLMHDAKKYRDWFLPFVGDGVIGLDGRCYDTGNVNVLIVDD